MESSSIRVRFAPSPTGFLHIGGVRTALFNYLFAKGRGGAFVLRIEDTDTERSEPAYAEDILKSLRWLGLDWDEGPLFQSHRFERYREAARDLLAAGHAYYCACAEEDVDAERARMEAAKVKPRYGGRCRDLRLTKEDVAGKRAVVRFRCPQEGSTLFVDLIRGKIKVEHQELEDFVLLRANDTPTYNLACVVDDFDGKMTHVIRGDDHINNTPKQVLLFRALGHQPPLYAHLPMILGADKKKLSKRHGAVSANQFRADGYLPHAVVNSLARLGWGHGDQEIFSREELIRLFSLEKIGKSGAVFNAAKLDWLNAHYMKQAGNAELAGLLSEDFGLEREKLFSGQGMALVGLGKLKTRTLKELAGMLRPLFSEALELEWAADVFAQWKGPKIALPLQEVLTGLRRMESGMTPDALENLFRAAAENSGLKLVELAQPARYFISGSTVGPPLFDVMARMPVGVVLGRLERGVALIA